MRWWQYLGPWPLRPVAAALLSALLFTAFTSGQRFGAGAAVTTQTTAGVLVASCASGLLVGLLLLLWLRVGSNFVTRGWGYAIAIASTSIVVALIRLALGWFPLENFATRGGALAYAALRLAVLLLVVMATVGYTSRRLRIQGDVTTQALALARHRQELLVDADESTRRQVAALLHDRVQAGLVASCLQLQSMAAKVSATERAEINGLIGRIEQLRALDVRGAARVLSPDLSNVDLQTALEDLAAQYEPGMSCDVAVAEVLIEQGAPVDEQTLLGAYRIAEQALLNAAVHGRAAHCTIRVALEDDTVVVEVADDGRGLGPGAVRSGLGSALMETWSGILGGGWTLTAEPGGAVLRATLRSRP